MAARSTDEGLITRLLGDAPLVYFVRADGGGPIKIGMSTGIRMRLMGLRYSSPIPLHLLGVIRSSSYDAMLLDERAQHRRFARYRLHGEWFRPASPLLRYVDENVENLDDLAQELGAAPPEATMTVQEVTHIPRLLRPEEAAGRLGTSARAVCRMALAGEISYVKIGRQFRFNADEIFAGRPRGPDSPRAKKPFVPWKANVR